MGLNKHSVGQNEYKMNIVWSANAQRIVVWYWLIGYEASGLPHKVRQVPIHPCQKIHIFGMLFLSDLSVNLPMCLSSDSSTSRPNESCA